MIIKITIAEKLLLEKAHNVTIFLKDTILRRNAAMRLPTSKRKIDLAKTIDTKDFYILHNEKYFPAGKIYEFIVLHEICHMEHPESLGMDYYEEEKLIDQCAYKKLFHKEPPPDLWKK